jgi:hypothetical protein
MIAFLLGELAVAALATLVFLVLYGNPNRRVDRGMAWHVFAFSATTGLQAAGLLLVGLGVKVPLWALALLLGGVAGTAVWRLVLLIQLHRDGPRTEIGGNRIGGTDG